MACQLLPTDVHDTATKIGQEFQRLIEEYGASSVSAMVPAVVSALEQLESYVEEYQRLQTKNFKLRLEKDSLLAERERREKLEEEKRELLEQLHRWEPEAKGLALQVERLQRTNDGLNRTIDKLRSAQARRVDVVADQSEPFELHTPPPDAPSEGSCQEDLKGEGSPVEFLNNAGGSREYMDVLKALKPGARVYSISQGDILQTSRIHRRLSSTASQLERTTDTLLNLQRALEKLTEENGRLKVQVEEYKAEISLQSMLESGEVPEDMQAKPKFYKRDLLVVLREKHELKEELDTTREELAMAKTELRRLEGSRGYQRRRSDTNVRDIVDSFTESVRLQTMPGWVHVRHPPKS